MKRHENDIVMQDYFKEVFIKILPTGKVGNVTSFDRIIRNIHLDPRNYYYKGSDYFLNPNERKFIHITSFDSFLNIITTGKLRLYDLNNVDDPNEIIFPAKYCGIEKKYNYSRLKSFIHSFAFCDYENINEEIEYNMWRLYGKNGTGVGIVFNFINDCEQWLDFNLSEIFYYNKETIDNRLFDIKEAIDKHKIFANKLAIEGGVQHNQDIELPIDLFKLLSFHKSAIYSLEKEYRLIGFNRPNWSIIANRQFNKTITLNKQKKLTSFIELPIANLSSKSMDSKEYPLLNIYEIILGYDFQEIDCEKIQASIEEIRVENNLVNSSYLKGPQIKMSSLKEKYFS